MRCSSSVVVRWSTLGACLLLATAAWAQPPGGGRFGGGRGPGGPGGPGMFGGGMFGGPMGNNPLMLVGNEAVQEDLKLSEKQQQAIEKLLEAYHDDQREEFEKLSAGPGFGGDDDVSPEERQKQMQKFREKLEAMNKKLRKKYEPRLAKAIDKKQMERLRQIGIQAAGAAALQDADVAKDLKLTKDQQSEIAAVFAAAQKQTQELFGGMRGPGGRGRRGAAGGEGAADRDDRPRRRPTDGDQPGSEGEADGERGPGGPGGPGGDFQERFEKVREIHEERDRKAMAVLTDEQRTEFDELKGEEFDVEALRPRFGGGGGSGGPGGQPGTGRQRPPM